MHVYYAKESPIPSPVIMPPSPMLSPMFNSQEIFLPEELLPPKKCGRDRSMPPKKTSTFAAPAMTQAAIRKLVADSITTALEAQAANMANADDTNRKPEPREAPVARKCSYKEFMSRQPFNFKCSEGAVRLIHWFERTESVFSRSNCTKDCKITSSGWPFVSTIPGHVANLVASITLDSARSGVMQVPGPMTHLVISLTPDSANSYVMQVVIVVVISIVVFVAIVRVVVVVVGSSISSINKLSLVIVGSFSCYWSFTCPGVSIVSICHVISLCFQSSNNAISNQLPNDSLSHNWCYGC
nr:reverse transcriptase domain-containing protein [Tanacetum cinerariifolium]